MPSPAQSTPEVPLSTEAAFLQGSEAMVEEKDPADSLLDTLRGLQGTLYTRMEAIEDPLFDDIQNEYWDILPPPPAALSREWGHPGVHLSGVAALLFPDLAQSADAVGLGDSFGVTVRAMHLYTRLRMLSTPQAIAALTLVDAALIVAQEAIAIQGEKPAE
jgi:hypothetical protein